MAMHSTLWNWGCFVQDILTICLPVVDSVGNECIVAIKP